MKNRNVVRPKHYDRPGHRSQTAATVDLKAPSVDEFEHSTADIAGLTPKEVAARLYPHERALITNTMDDSYTAEQRQAAGDFFRRVGIVDDYGLWSTFGKAVRTAALDQMEGADPYSIFNELSAGEKATLDPTLSYGAGWQHARSNLPIRGNSPEYQDGYLAGLKVREESE